MASFGETTALMLVAVLVLQVISPSSGGLIDDTKANPNDLSEDICSTSLDPTFCLQVIKSIPGVASATSLESLGETAITFSRSEGGKTLEYIQSLVKSVKNPRLKENYRSCSECYDGAVSSMEKAQGLLQSKDYRGLSFVVSAGMTYVETCKDRFAEAPITDPSELPQKNKYFSMLCAIILRVANKLDQ